MPETPAERLEAARARLRESAEGEARAASAARRARNPRSLAAGALRRLAGRLDPRPERPSRHP